MAISSLVTTFLGPDILPYFDDPDIVEIYTNKGYYWAESFEKGRYNTGIPIADHTIVDVIKAVSGEVGLVIDSYLQANYQPLNCRFQGQFDKSITDEPTFVFRKRAKKIITIQEYLDQGRLSHTQYEFLIQAILDRKNIVIAGGTGSGKTTFAQAVLLEITRLCPHHRLGILEDTPEIQVRSNDSFFLHTFDGNKLQDEITMRDLLKVSLRMSPDRIVIGEVRDASALDVMKAWNTGHNGGICTVHATSPELTLDRLEELIIEEYQSGSFKKLIGNSVDIVVFLDKIGEINRSIQSIISVHGYDEKEREYRIVEEV